MLHTKHVSCGLHGLKEEDFLKFFFLYKSMGVNDPRGVASLDSRALTGRMYVVDQYTLLHTKYISSGPHGFREEDFFKVFLIMSMGANEPRGVASLDPRGLIGSI